MDRGLNNLSIYCIYHYNYLSRKINKYILYIYVQHVVWNWCFCFVFVDGTMVRKQMLPHEAHATHKLLICADKWIRKILVVIIWEESASCKEWSARILLQSLKVAIHNLPFFRASSKHVYSWLNFIRGMSLTVTVGFFRGTISSTKLISGDRTWQFNRLGSFCELAQLQRAGSATSL